MFTKKMKAIGGLVSIIVLATSIAKAETKKELREKALATVASNEIIAMSFNVENLFDAKHDEGKRDWFYLPKNYPEKQEKCMLEPKRYRKSCLSMDWTEKKLEIKLKKLAKLIKATGPLPDILGLQEVENEYVVKRLGDILGYDGMVFHDAEDKRGIDVALLYRTRNLRLRDWSSRSPNSPDFDRPTRDILTGYFEVKGTKETLVVYVNHWPSQAAPAPKRVAVAKKLKEFMENDRRIYQSRYHGLVLGDFNTVPADWPHPHKDVITNYDWDNYLLDVHRVSKKKKALPYDFPLGTYFYFVKMEWNYLDKFFITQNLNDGAGIEYMPESYQIHRLDFATHDFVYDRKGHPQFGSVVKGVPIRSNHNATTLKEAGFSDHLPTSVRFKINK